MDSLEPTKVLVVIGDPGFAALAAKALTHPRLQVEVAVTEQSIVAALTTRQFDLVLAGGHVGKRGPLVLCDVVRIRQPSATVVVLVREETEEAPLRDHVARQLPRVHYVDLRGVAPGLDHGVRIRGTALGVMQLEEDPTTASTWPQLLGSAEASPAVAEQPMAAEYAAPGPSSPEEERVEDGGEGAPEAAGGAPVLSEAVTDDDLAFAARMVGRSRGIDFRSPVQPTQAPEGTDRATAKLRDRVRELERHLARVAHVYAGRSREFEGAAARIADAQAAREAVERDLARLKDHAAEEREQWRAQKAEREAQLDAQTRRAEMLESRAAELGAEVGRLRDELKAQETSFAGVLKQAQDAFTQLRDQSAQALAFYERRVAEQDKVQAAHEQALMAARAGYDQEIGNLRTAYQQAVDRVGQLTKELEAHAQGAGELAATRGALEDQRTLATSLQTRVNELEGQLASAQATLAQGAEHESQTVAQAEQRYQEVLAAKAAAAAAVEERLHAAEVELQARGATLVEREREVATLLAKIEGRERELQEAVHRTDDQEKELARLRKSDAELRDELEKSKEKTLQRALDARLVAIEEHARLAAESSSRHGEFLAALDQRTVKQATLVDRLLRIIEPPGSAGGGEVSPVIAARRLAERMRPDEGAWGRLGRRLREPVWAIGLATAVVLVVAVVLLVALGGREETTDVRPATTATVVRAGAESAAGHAKADAGKRPGDAAAEQASAAATAGDDAAAEEKDEAGKASDGKSAAAKTAKAGEPAAAAGKDKAPKEAPAAATAEAPASADDLPIVLTPEERKNLRRKMFDSYKARKWDEAANAGLRLRAATKLDWEAQLNLAQSLRFAGRTPEAVDMFKAFLAEFPENRYVGEAKATLEKLTKK